MGCQDSLRPTDGVLEIPNCDDPVFRAWCRMCGLHPGQKVAEHDVRIQWLENMIADPRYDPEQDPLDDPFPEEGLPY